METGYLTKKIGDIAVTPRPLQYTQIFLQFNTKKLLCLTILSAAKTTPGIPPPCTSNREFSFFPVVYISRYFYPNPVYNKCSVVRLPDKISKKRPNNNKKFALKSPAKFYEVLLRNVKFVYTMSSLP